MKQKLIKLKLLNYRIRNDKYDCVDLNNFLRSKDKTLQKGDLAVVDKKLYQITYNGYSKSVANIQYYKVAEVNYLDEL